MRLIDGGELNTSTNEYLGKVYPQIQHPTSYAKTIFSPFYANSEWTTCYLPFTGIDNIAGAGIRFGGMAQKIEIKNISIINYGQGVDINTLPSTILN